jgi:hypothetical protein
LKFGGSAFASDGDPTQKSDLSMLSIAWSNSARGQHWTRFYSSILAGDANLVQIEFSEATMEDVPKKS